MCVCVCVFVSEQLVSRAKLGCPVPCHPAYSLHPESTLSCNTPSIERTLFTIGLFICVGQL